MRPPRREAAAHKLLARQRFAAEALRRELLETVPYVRAFDRRLRDYRSPVTGGTVESAVVDADIVYVGDFHAVPAYQRYAADLLESIARRHTRLTLGIEFVYTRQQHLLDRRQTGALPDDEFLRRIHYDEEWGFAWDGFRELLDRASRWGVEVRALDAPPRGGADRLRRRDEHAARRIADLLRERRDTTWLVLFGETHLLPDRLPRSVDRKLARLGIERTTRTVFQNPDRIYWRAIEREPVLPEAVRVDDRSYAVLHTSPLEKYEAYRQVLERWQSDVPVNEEVDLTPAVHHLIHALLRQTGIRPTRRRVMLFAGWTEELDDVLPEVYSGPQATRLLEPILTEHGRTTEQRDEASAWLRNRGACYDSRSNAIFLSRYLPGPAAGEAARFLRAALTGRLFAAADGPAGSPVEATYGAAFTEALAYVGSRLVDPTTDYLTAPSEVVGVDEAIRLGLSSHRRFERSSHARPPGALVEIMTRSRPVRQAIARDVGRRLGARLFERFRSGDLARSDLRRLLGRRLAPGRAGSFTLKLLRERPSGRGRSG